MSEKSKKNQSQKIVIEKIDKIIHLGPIASEPKIMAKKKLPVIMTRAIVMFSGLTTSLEVGRERSIHSINESITNYDGYMIQVCQKDPNSFEPKLKDLYSIGNLCKVVITKTHENNDISINITAIDRVVIKEIEDSEKFNLAIFDEFLEKSVLTEENKEIILESYESIRDDIGKNKNFDAVEIKKLFNVGKVSSKSLDILCSLLNNDFIEKQRILEELDINKRTTLYTALSIPKETADGIDEKISRRISSNLAKQQKEFYLRERIKTIKEELGDITNKKDDVDALREKVNNNPYPESIKEKILFEISRIESSSNSNEASVVKTYIDLLLALPWWQKTEDNSKIEDVESILNKNHYGLETVKERIIEYLAIKMRSPKVKGSVICLVGPPGVGKTSLAISIAEALGKKFCKVSLNGMRDESEIKGHRKTYIGAMPGRIIREMKKVGVINPLFLLDEIDKLSSDQRGDPAATLLDILDIEQNAHFSDNYVEEDYNLSNVLFIATANYEENIPSPLLDRLEIIRLSSYTELEKQSIAEKYLVKKILDESNITTKELLFTSGAIEYIIKNYTREAGVRELERKIREISRKFVVLLSKNEISNDIISQTNVNKYLKKEIYENTMKDENSIPGVVNGMAYTSFGGDLLPIEVSFSSGKGKIVITGNLKETMKESASVSVAFVRSNAIKYGVEIDFSTIDIHIHVPAGGIPKDGPSAGVAITTALLSALKKFPIPTNVSMTGEITLRGKVTIIGGVKEKVISASRAGVTEIFMPKADERYIDEIPKEVLRLVKINLVSFYDEIFNALFLNKV
ncbi:MAG: endopeptidase La [Mycoplasmoidaceae bacterium]